MPTPKTAPYGAWASPLSARAIAAGSRPLGAPMVGAGGELFWIEGLADEGGRSAVVRADANGARTIVTPAPFNARSRVHEYGGGAALIAQGAICFSNFADNLVYLQRGDAAPLALTQDSLRRHADFVFDAGRQRLIAVREDHSCGGAEAVNTIAGIALDGSPDNSRVLASGFDFYAAPRLSPDGRRLAWLCWNHPAMPWNETELWLADVAADGSLAGARRVAGGDGEALCQPRWSPRGELFVVSDRTGWWNLYRVAVNGLAPLCPMAAAVRRSRSSAAHPTCAPG